MACPGFFPTHSHLPLPQTQVIRPGHFVPGPIRESGLKRPLLIKGDRYNFNPQMGVALLDTGLTAAELEERMDKEKEVGWKSAATSLLMMPVFLPQKHPKLSTITLHGDVCVHVSQALPT